MIHSYERQNIFVKCTFNKINEVSEGSASGNIFLRQFDFSYINRTI